MSLPQGTASGSGCTLREAPHSRIYAVVVNWNGGDHNLASIASLLAQGIPEDAIVFVDNGSTDGSREAVMARHPGLRLIANQANLGFGDGVNQGLRLALDEGADYVFLSNNDIEFPAGTVGRLVEELEGDASLGIAGPRVLYMDDPGRVWAAGGTLSFRQNLTTLIGHRELDRPELSRTYHVDFVPGCAMLIRRAVLEQAGLMEGDYFAYLEDVDFCVRALASGFGVVHVGEARALHRPHSSTGGGYNPRRKYMMAVNAIWFLRRHGTPLRWARFFVYDVLTLPPLYLAGVFNGRHRAVLAKLRGTFDGIRGRHVTAQVVEEIH